MTFSIIIPIYNVEEYLSICIESVINQTFIDWELLLVDDGSPDGCPQICDEYEKRDNRIHTLHKVNGGLSSARNHGMQYASGDWIIFLDGDDWINDEALSKFAAEISGDADMLQGRIVYVSPNEKTWVSGFSGPLLDADASTQYADFLKRAKDTPCWAAWQWCYRRTLLKSNALIFKNGILSEDSEWLPRVVLRARKIKFVDYPFYNYRLGRAGSIMTQQSNKRVLDFSDTAAGWSEWLKTHTCNNAFKQTLYEQLFRRVLFELSTVKNFSGNEQTVMYKNIEKCAEQKIPMRRMASRIARQFVRILGVKATHHILRALNVARFRT